MTAAMTAPELAVRSATGVDVLLPIAAVGARAHAFVIDWVLRLALSTTWYVAGALIYNKLAGNKFSLRPPDDDLPQWIYGIVLPSVALYFLYHPVLEVSMRGRTPGKRWAGLRIMMQDGSNATLGALLTRNVFRLVDMFPGIYIFGLLTAYFSRMHQRLGDVAAGTLLVHESRQPAVVRPDIAIFDNRSHASREQAAMHDVAAALSARWSELDPQARATMARKLLLASGDTERAAHADDDALRAAIAAITTEPSPATSGSAGNTMAPPRQAIIEIADANTVIDSYRTIATQVANARRTAPQSLARTSMEAAYGSIHAELQRPAVHAGYALWSLFRDQLPRSVRQLRPHIAWITAWFVLTTLAGWAMVNRFPDLAQLFASSEMIEKVERGELWTDGLLNVAPSSIISVQILTNNIVVSFFAYCTGFLFGLGSLYLIGTNGLMLGALFALCRAHGIDGRLFEFVVAHGLVELSCICLAGAAGAAVGEALIRPGAATRAEAFAAAARRSGPVLGAVVVLLLGCGFVEGYVSPDPDMPLAARIIIGGGYFLLMIALLQGWLFGRSRGTSEVLA